MTISDFRQAPGERRRAIPGRAEFNRFHEIIRTDGRQVADAFARRQIRVFREVIRSLRQQHGRGFLDRESYLREMFSYRYLMRHCKCVDASSQAQCAGLFDFTVR